jgi:sugar/nucleoside kinase (ribokinase family)
VVEVAGVPTTVVDTTGAGDAFAAGLLSAWIAGAAPRDALLAGARLGALAVGRVGARPLLRS